MLEQSLELKLKTERQSLNRQLMQERTPFTTILNLHREAFQRHNDFYLSRYRQLERLKQDLIIQHSDFEFAQSDFKNMSTDLIDLDSRVHVLQLERTRLERKVEIYRETFIQFSRLIEEARIAQNRAAGDIQIVSRASSFYSEPSKTYQTLIWVTCIGFLLSTFLSFSLEYFQKARDRLNSS